jgi:hypothetical protein
MAYIQGASDWRLASRGDLARAAVWKFLETEMFKYDPELMDKARWIIERGADKPKEVEVERRPFLELPLPEINNERSNLK